MSKTNYALNTNEFLLQKLLHQNVLCYIKRRKKRTITSISICLPCFLMEVFASQPGSVESLRKANDIPGNNSTFRNLNQHCSACARVKTEPCVNPDLYSHFFPLASQIDCVVLPQTLKWSWHPSQIQTCADCTLWPSLSDPSYHCD